jgi:flagellin FlaB
MVTPRAGSYEIDLSTTIVEISNSSVKCILKYIGTSTNPNFASSPSSNGIFQTTDSVGMFNQRANSFGVIEIVDKDNSCSATSPVINRGDMVLLCINLSACFWGLDERADVWGTIIPEEGASVLFQFSVPGFSDDAVYKLF